MLFEKLSKKNDVKLWKFFREISRVASVLTATHYHSPTRRKTYCNLASGVVVIATAQLHSTKPELRFCAGSNLTRGVSKVRDSEEL